MNKLAFMTGYMEGLKKISGIMDTLDPNANSHRMGQIAALHKAHPETLKNGKIPWTTRHPGVMSSLAFGTGGGIASGAANAAGADPVSSAVLGAGAGLSSAALYNHLMNRNKMGDIKSRTDNKPANKAAVKKALSDFSAKGRFGNDVASFFNPMKGSYDKSYVNALQELQSTGKLNTAKSPSGMEDKIKTVSLAGSMMPGAGSILGLPGNVLGSMGTDSAIQQARGA